MTHMHETHERTGATDKQIEEAARRVYYGLMEAGTGFDDLPPTMRTDARRNAKSCAELICPPGTVIVPEAVVAAGTYLAKYYLKDGNRAVVELDRMESFRAALDAMGGEG